MIVAPTGGDDTQLLQEALSAMPPYYGSVELVAGETYLLGSGLAMGRGKYGSQLRGNGARLKALAGADIGVVLDLTGANRTLVDDLVVETTVANSCGAAIKLARCTQGVANSNTFRNVVINGSFSDAAIVSLAAEVSLFDTVRINQMAVGGSCVRDSSCDPDFGSQSNVLKRYVNCVFSDKSGQSGQSLIRLEGSQLNMTFDHGSFDMSRDPSHVNTFFDLTGITCEGLTISGVHMEGSAGLGASRVIKSSKSYGLVSLAWGKNNRTGLNPEALIEIITGRLDYAEMNFRTGWAGKTGVVLRMRSGTVAAYSTGVFPKHGLVEICDGAVQVGCDWRSLS